MNGKRSEVVIKAIEWRLGHLRYLRMNAKKEPKEKYSTEIAELERFLREYEEYE